MPQTTDNRSTIFSNGSTNFGHDGSTLRSSSSNSCSYQKNTRRANRPPNPESATTHLPKPGSESKTREKEGACYCYQLAEEGANTGSHVFGLNDIEGWELEILQKRIAFV